MITPYIIEELERDLYNTEWFSLSFSVEICQPPRPECPQKSMRLELNTGNGDHSNS